MVLQFFILIFIFTYKIQANQETIIDASDVLYKNQSVKDKLDELYGTANEVIYNGNVIEAEVFQNKTGISRGKFINGTMKNHSNIIDKVNNIRRFDDQTVIFDVPENGYYLSTSIFEMNFGNKRKVKIDVNGYLNTSSKVKTPSSWIKMYVDFTINRATVVDTSGKSINSSNRLTLEFGKIANFKVTSSVGYHLSRVTCVTCEDGNYCEDGTYTYDGGIQGRKACSIGYYSSAGASSCTINTYTVTLSGSNVSFGSSTLSVNYGSSNTIKITPSSGYYFESMSCTNGYSNNLSTGSSHYSAQTVTISNNSKLDNSTCTVKMHARSYAATSYACQIAVEEKYHPFDGVNHGDHNECSCGACSWQNIEGCQTHTVYRDSTCYKCPNGGTLSGTTCKF